MLHGIFYHYFPRYFYVDFGDSVQVLELVCEPSPQTSLWFGCCIFLRCLFLRQSTLYLKMTRNLLQNLRLASNLWYSWLSLLMYGFITCLKYNVNSNFNLNPKDFLFLFFFIIKEAKEDKILYKCMMKRNFKWSKCDL